MMAPHGPTIEDIKSAANARMFDVLAALGVRQRPTAAGYLSMCNPMRKDRHPSLTIWTRNGFVSFKDHAGGAQGDVIGLVAYLKGWDNGRKKGVAEACRFLVDLLGLADVSPAQLQRDRDAARRVAAQINKKSEQDMARQQGSALALWLSAAPLLGSLSEHYLLRARGIDLRSFLPGARGGVRWPTILRHLPAHEHRESGRLLPCMIAGCVDYRLASPKIMAVHRTWLRLDGGDKADVTPARKVWPGFSGLVIPVWQGANGPVRAAIAAGVRETLVLVEGIEDGLTAALAAPDKRVWAVIALGNLGNVPLPECVDSVLVHRQNDWHKPQAVAQFERGLRALEASGRAVAEVSV